MEWSHGFTHEVKRILVPEADNLVITPHEGQVYAWVGFEGEYEVVKEIEVPDELVEKALAFTRVKKKFDELEEDFKALL